MPRRYDRSILRKAHRTPEGFLQFECIATRAGVFEYLNVDGSTRREWRPPDEVARADSLATLGKKPVTLMHPRRDGQSVMVDPSNSDDYVKGSTGDEVEVLAVVDGIEDSGPFVRVTGQVFQADAINAIESNAARAVSCGYDCEIEPTAGVTPDGERYDAIQRDIQYNHLALVPRGRAGHVAVLRVDEASVYVGAAFPTPHKDGRTMEKFELKEIADMLRAMRADMDAMKEDEEEKADMDKMDAMAKKMDVMAEKMDRYEMMMEEREDMKEKMDSTHEKLMHLMELVKGLMEDDGVEMEEEEEMREDALDTLLSARHDARMEWHRERARLEEMAKALRIDGADEMSDRDLRVALAGKVSTRDVRADASDDYLNGIIDAAKIDAEDEAYRAVGGAIADARSSRADDDLSARERYIQSLGRA